MTKQEVFDKLAQDADNINQQLNAIALQVTTLQTQKADILFLINKFSFIESLATQNNIAIDDPKLFVLYKASYNLAVEFVNETEGQDVNVLTAHIFTQLVSLIK